MQDKVLFGLLAIAACATAASISGTAAVDPRRIYVGGQLVFPRIPGINSPLFGYRRPSNSSANNNSASSNNAGRIPFPVIPGVNYPLFGYRQTTNNNNNNNNNSNNDSSTTPSSNNNSSTSENPNSNSSTTQNSNNSSTSNDSNNNSSTTPSSNNNSSTSNDPNNNSSTTQNSNNNSSTSNDSNNNSSTTPSSNNNSSTSNDPNNNSSTTPSSNNEDSTKASNSRSGPFTSFISKIPGLNLLVPGSSSSLPSFPNINDLISGIPGINNRNSNGTSGMTVPSIKLPSVNDGPYIPGVSEALNEARAHVMASLNITTDLSTGIRDAVQTAMDSDNPAASIGIILSTIAKVYNTVAANCPLIVVGTRVAKEGVRLAYEVARSVGNVAVGSNNNIMP